MCGIVGAISTRNVRSILLDGLKHLEYRGYDSAGMAIITANGKIERVRSAGKIQMLESALNKSGLNGRAGIAHTRWATHGVPHEKNAHPFISRDQFALVHNGIIENHAVLRSELLQAGYDFSSDTDSEVIVHLLHFYHQDTQDFLVAVQKTIARLEGAWALAIASRQHPEKLIAIRHGSPLVIGKGVHENFIASDPLALLQVTREFIYLEENDIAVIETDSIIIVDKKGQPISRDSHHLTTSSDISDRGEHRHYMLREIFSQPDAIQSCLKGNFGKDSSQTFENIRHILLIACGTSYHAALVARYWLEAETGITCSVEVASEYRYRHAVIPDNSLAVFISQSGETADTLAALRLVKQHGKTATLAICNVAESSLVRESDLNFLTRAGTEIGVASTKAFTTQLVALLLLTHTFKKHEPTLLQKLPDLVRDTLALDEKIRTLASHFTAKHNALFIGRDSLFPIALEGALKLKEISYIHAEGYPAGELKHGPLALVDPDMPVIVLAPNNTLFAKICSGIQEVCARAGKLYVLTDNPKAIASLNPNIQIIPMPKSDPLLAPVIYTIPLQLLAYHVAVLKGTDVDQPRNLAKSVTVE